MAQTVTVGIAVDGTVTLRGAGCREATASELSMLEVEVPSVASAVAAYGFGLSLVLGPWLIVWGACLVLRAVGVIGRGASAG